MTMAVSVLAYILPFFCSFTLILSTDPEDYLKKYGYLEIDPAAVTNGEELLSSSILKFQDYQGLPLTGVLDDETLQGMAAPRCGMADFEPEHSESGRLKRYAIASKWRRKDLKYLISKYSEKKSLAKSSIDNIFSSALDLWQDSADLTFTKTHKEKHADLIVSFVKGSHETNRTSHMDKKLSFDGPGGVLAHASFPTVGEIHFDDDENWLLNGAQKDGYDLMWGAVHEIGHALGLKHTKVKDSVMNPVYKRGVFDKLGDDDIEGIVKLYGTATKKVTEAVTTMAPWDASASTDFAMMSSTKETCIVPDDIDAVLTIGKAFFMFRGDQVWMYNQQDSMPHYPVKISSVFPGISGPITAAMAGINSKVYFFRNKMMWRWDWVRKSVDRGFPKHIKDFGGIHDNIVAAFKWSHNSKGYLFGSNGKYWRYDFWSNRIDPGYPRTIRTWRGIPNSLDAITSAPDGKTYVFKAKSYWLYSNRLYRLQGQRYETENKWLSCEDANANFVSMEDSSEEVAALVDSSSTPGHFASTILVSVLALLIV